MIVLRVAQNRKARRHVKVDDEVWHKSHLLRLYLRKRSINDVLRQVLQEWEEISGIKVDMEVVRFD